MVLLLCLFPDHSYEGERTQCRDNRLLGEFELTGIPPMPRGQAELVTTFEIDANGLLKVSAQDRSSGRKASISESFEVLHHHYLPLISSQLLPTLSDVYHLPRSTR